MTHTTPRLAGSDCSGAALPRCVPALNWGALEELKRILTREEQPAVPRLALIAHKRSLLRAVGGEQEILGTLGAALIRKYFLSMEGRATGNPYYLPAGLQEDLLGAYLHFELYHDDQPYQRGCVLEFIRAPILEGHPAEERAADFGFGCNLTISHLRSEPLTFARLMVSLTSREMNRFLRGIDSFASPDVRSIFGHLFDHARIQLVDRYVRSYLANEYAEAAHLLLELNALDSKFFDDPRSGSASRS